MYHRRNGALSMLRGIRTKSMWRRLVSWAAVYALVLQSILAGMVAPAAAATDGIAGFELCLHSVDAADPGTGTPNQHPGDQTHCKFCLSVAHAAAPAPRPLPGVTFDLVVALAQPARDADIPSPPELSNEQPRGPPHEA